MTRDEFEKNKNLWGTGTHASAIKLIGFDLIRKEKNDYKVFQRLIPELKELREKSDYENVAISQSEGWEAIQNSDSIKNILSKNYK